MQTTRLVHFQLTIRRPGPVAAPNGFSYIEEDAVEYSAEIRAEVTDLGTDEAPCVVWLDAGYVTDLGLDAEELVGATEAAIDAFDRVDALVKCSPRSAGMRVAS